MTNLSPEICLKLRDARRAAKLSQSEVSAEVGCKQSALSMFEQGDGTKLNEAVIEKLAEKFGVSLAKEARPAAVAVSVNYPAAAAAGVRGFCPNPQCPSNQSYDVGGRTLFRPDRTAADPVHGKYCALCGEILEKRCPNCGVPVHDGAICSICGEPYVAVP